MRYDSIATIPPRLEWQIRTLLYAEWPGPDETDAAQPLIAAELHPVYFVLADEEQVLSCARTIWAPVSHLGQSLKLYGLGDVITKPEFRHQGYGRYIVEEATAHIKSDREADAEVLLTETKLEPLYRRSGWGYIPKLQVTTGEHDGCAAGESFPMMLFLSAKARSMRETFSERLLVLPGNEW